MEKQQSPRVVYALWHWRAYLIASSQRTNSRETWRQLPTELNSVHYDVMDIKEQAEAAHSSIVSLEDPKEDTGWFEKHLEKTNFAHILPRTVWVISSSP